MAYSWLPAVTDVELYVPQRITDSTGHFSAASVPTSTQVTSLIALAAEEVYGAVGDVGVSHSDLVNAAKHVTALGTAVLIESGYTSNEAEEKSPRLATMEQRYEKALDRLAKAAQEGPGEAVPSSAFAFPDINDPNENAPGQTAHATRLSTAF